MQEQQRKDAPAILVALVAIVVLGFLVWLFWLAPQGQEAEAPAINNVASSTLQN